MTEAGGAASRAALLLVVAAAAVTLVGALPLAGGLVAAPALAVICRPAYERLARRAGPRRAALLVVGVVWVALVVPGAWLASRAIRQLPDAVHDVRESAARLHMTQIQIPGVNPDSVVAHVGAQSVGWLSTAIGPALAGIGHAVADLSIALLGLYFLLVTGATAWNAVRRHLPFSPDDSDELRRTFVDVTRATKPRC